MLIGGCDDQFELEPDDVLGELLERGGASVTPAQLLDDDVFTLDPAKSTQAFLPGLDKPLAVGLHHADPAHRRCRLRVGGEASREESHRTREKCPPVHHAIP